MTKQIDNQGHATPVSFYLTDDTGQQLAQELHDNAVKRVLLQSATADALLALEATERNMSVRSDMQITQLMNFLQASYDLLKADMAAFERAFTAPTTNTNQGVMQVRGRA